MPTALQLEELKWIVITSENAEEVFRKLEEKGIDPVLFSLTDKDFEMQAKKLYTNKRKRTHEIPSSFIKLREKRG